MVPTPSTALRAGSCKERKDGAPSVVVASGKSKGWATRPLKVRGKLLACVPTHRSAEPGSLAVRVGFDDRAELLAAAPDVYYVTDHYLGYSAALVRLSRVTPDLLRDLLGMARKFVTASDAGRSSSRNRRKPV